MDEHKDINNRLDELFAKARSGKPVMGVDEVRNLIATVPVAATSSGDKTSKSNFTLYVLLGCIAVLAITAGIWLNLDTDIKPVQVSQNGGVPIENNSVPDINASKKEQESQSDPGSTDVNNNDINNNETSATDNKSANEVIPSKGNEKDVAKSHTGLTEKNNPVETNPELSKNKTYLVTGGDFKVEFKTEDKDVKIKLNEDNVKELSINGKVIASTEYPKYKDIIDQGKKMMIEEKAKNPSTSASTKSPEEERRDEINKRLFTAFTEQLKKDKLINEDKYSFKLTSSELLIDGKPQPESVRQKYIDLFKATSGRDIGGATFKFDHGMN